MKIKWPDSEGDFYKINDGKIVEIVNSGEVDKLFYEYANKFHIASGVLVDHLLEKPDIRKLDTYFFAVAYLYRHSIELILKAIGFKYIVDLKDKKQFIKETHHNLLELMNRILPYITKFTEKNKNAFEWLETYFDDINNIDRESDSFRYPFGISIERDWFDNKKFSIHPVFSEQIHIDLIMFANKLETAFELFESIYQDILEEVTDYKEYNPIFIEEGGDYYSQCVVGYGYNKWKHYPYVTAYKESAEYMHGLMLENSSMIENLFMPMCYLFRNSIELSIKQLLFEECSFSTQEALKIFNKKKHSIQSLWNAIKNEIEEHANAPEDDTTIEDVSKYIKQLHSVDASADRFRYPTNKHMNLHFKKKKKLDLTNVCDFFLELASFISAATDMISAHNEWKAEMEAEYSSYYDY
jgi:hypothetical protein